jgi:hypothetical protein
MMPILRMGFQVLQTNVRQLFAGNANRDTQVFCRIYYTHYVAESRHRRASQLLAAARRGRPLRDGGTGGRRIRHAARASHRSSFMTFETDS